MSQNKTKIVCIIVMWGLLIYVGYNVLTVEAADFKKSTEKEDKKVCESYGGEWKERMFADGSGRSSGERGCEGASEGYGYRPGWSLSGTGSDDEYGIEDLVSYDEDGNKVYPDIPKHLQEKQTPKEICKGFDSGKWNDDSNKCEFSKQGIKIEDDAEFDHVLSDNGLIDAYYEEVAAKEDAICDDEDADTTNIKLCMSDERKQEVEEREESDREMYTSKTFKNLLQSKGIDYDDYNNGKLSTEKQDELETEFREDKAYEYGEEINSKKEPVIEDWGNTVKTEEEQARDKVIKIVEESEEGNEVHGNAEIDYTTDSSDNESSNDEEQEQDEPAEQEEESNDDNESEESSDSNNEESE